MKATLCSASGCYSSVHKLMCSRLSCKNINIEIREIITLSIVLHWSQVWSPTLSKEIIGEQGAEEEIWA
jgi:hypothetical protein